METDYFLSKHKPRLIVSGHRRRIGRKKKAGRKFSFPASSLPRRT